MKRRIGLIWAIAVFLLPNVCDAAVSGAAFDGVYHAWARPHLAFDAETDLWIGVYVTRYGRAYEHRRGATGAITMVHVRYDGVCYQSSDGLQWVTRTCHTFLAIDGIFRQAAEAHRKREAAKKTDDR